MFFPVLVLGAPTGVVIAKFAGLDRRSPLVAAAFAAVAFLTYVAIDNITASVNSDAQGALVYLFVPLYSFPAALVGGFAAWGLDVLARRLCSTSDAVHRGPYR